MRWEANVVLAALERCAREAGLGPLGPVFSKAVLTSHLARSPRVDVIREYVRDLRSVGQDDGGFIEASTLGPKLRADCRGLPAIAALPVVAQEAAWAVEHEQPAIISLVNTAGMRTLDVWVRVLAASGVVCVMSWNGGPYVVVPYGSTVPFFGTNPFAYGIPTAGEPIVGDFATSEIAFMELMAARRNGTPLPAGAGIDAEGKSSNDAEAVFVLPDSARLLPMGGGPKGSAFMLLLEYLTGAFIGASMGHDASPTFTAAEFGGVILLLPEGTFRSAGEVRAGITKLGADIRSSTPVVGETEVRLPGDRGIRKITEAQKTGIELADETAMLLGLSGREE
jgi:LDH2 family malate/lactate/ureidoglycolate dehydrogenase